MSNKTTYGDVFFLKYYPKIELVAAVVFALGILFNLIHWPGGAFLVIAGGGAFGQLTFLRCFSPLSKNIFYSIMLHVASFIGIIGFLFKWMFWPGGSMFMMVGLIGLSVFLGLFYFKLQNQPDATWDKQSFKRALIVFFLVGILYGIPNLTLYKIKHSDDPKIVELYQKTLENPTDTLARQALQDYRKINRTR